jgi:hypothetical protein
LLTIIIELIIALILGVRNKKDIINIILVNVITNPIVVMSQTLLYIKFGYNIEMIGIAILEVLVVLVEGLIYKKVLNYKKINPILLSLILNALSFLIGELINLL